MFKQAVSITPNHYFLRSSQTHPNIVCIDTTANIQKYIKLTILFQLLSIYSMKVVHFHLIIFYEFKELQIRF